MHGALAQVIVAASLASAGAWFTSWGAAATGDSERLSHGHALASPPIAEAGAAPDEDDAETQPRDPRSPISLDGTAPSDTPSTRTGLAFLDLDEPLQGALDVLGPPMSSAPDIDGATAHTWPLPGAAELTVISDQPSGGAIVGIFAYVPAGSAVRLPLEGGLIVGVATPADVLSRWGEADALVADHVSDYVLAYRACEGPFPIVIKLDQASDSADTSDSWRERPITSVLIAYADAEPGTGGCR